MLIVFTTSLEHKFRKKRKRERKEKERKKKGRTKWVGGRKERGGEEGREKESKTLSPLESSDKSSCQLAHNLLRDCELEPPSKAASRFLTYSNYLRS